MTNLKSLQLLGAQCVPSKLCNLTNLTSLEIWDLAGLPYLPNLTELKIACHATDEMLTHLTNLTSLSFYNSNSVTGSLFQSLTNLKRLDFFYSDSFDPESLLQLKNLKTLDFSRYSKPESQLPFPALTSLTELKVRCKKFAMKDEDLLHLTNLTRLELLDQGDLSPNVSEKLPKLKQFFVGHKDDDDDESSQSESA